MTASFAHLCIAASVQLSKKLTQYTKEIKQYIVVQKQMPLFCLYANRKSNCNTEYMLLKI